MSLTGSHSLQHSNVLTLRLTDAEGTIDIPNPIPGQIMVLKQYTVKFNSQANADLNPLVYIRFPFIGTGQTITNTGINRMTLMVDGIAATYSAEPQVQYSLNKHIPRKFKYTIYNTSGAIASNSVILEVILVLEFKRGVISGA
jgi:hypothetical protein